MRRGPVVGPVTSGLVVAASGEFWWVERMGRIDLSLNRSSSSHRVPEQRESRVLIGGDGWVVIGRLLPGVIRRVVGVSWGHDRTPDATGQVTCPVRYRVGDRRSLGRWRGQAGPGPRRHPPTAGLRALRPLPPHRPHPLQGIIKGLSGPPTSRLAKTRAALLKLTGFVSSLQIMLLLLIIRLFLDCSLKRSRDHFSITIWRC